jgi:hypothetical protein
MAFVLERRAATINAFHNVHARPRIHVPETLSKPVTPARIDAQLPVVSKNASISSLNSKSAIEHGAFSADSPGNQAVGWWEPLRIQQEKD